MSAPQMQRLPDIRPAAQLCAGDLCASVPVVSPADTNGAVREIFDKHRDLISLPVVESGHPVGLIKRHNFLSEMAKPFRKELHERKSCLAFTDANALIVDASSTIDHTAQQVVAAKNNALADGFVVVRDGHYHGVAFGLDLMRIVADLQAEKHRQILQSIEYASVIQRAMLSASSAALSAGLADAQLIWEPRDTIGGDFFHFARFDDGWFLAIADCTGHGVPGAFMTLISSSWLTQSLERHGPHDPARLLAELNRNIKLSLSQTDTGTAESDDGLDAALLWFDAATRTLTYASAKTPLHVLAPDAASVQTLAVERMGVGYQDTPLEHAWANRKVTLAPNSIVCVTTDGFTDQIGGPKRIAFGKNRLRAQVLAHRRAAMRDFAPALMHAFRAYQSEQRRRDDVTLFCARI
jgi:serine phosphatase RsbU (regulator of sigma subunit)